MTPGFALFGTAIGYCGIAWGERGITGVFLPDGNAAQLRSRMQSRFPDAVEGLAPPEVQNAMRDVVALLSGKPNPPGDLSNIALDMEAVPPFNRRVYALATGTHHPAGDHAYLRRDRGAAGQPWPRARSRAGAGQQSVCARGALPPGAGRRRPLGWLLGQWRRGDQAAHAADRACFLQRAGLVRRSARRAVAEFDKHAGSSHAKLNSKLVGLTDLGW